MLSSSIVVEFIGPPGAGKSTLAELVDRRLRDQRIPVTGPSEARYALEQVYCTRQPAYCVMRRVGQRLRTLASCPRLALWAYSLASAVRPFQVDRVGAVDALLRFHRRVEEMRERVHGILLLDEGCVHLLWSLTFGGTIPGSSSAARQLCAVFFNRPASLFVHVDTPVKTCLERIQRRHAERTRFSSSTAEPVKLRLQNCANYARLLDIAGASVGERLFRIRTGCSAEWDSATIVDWLLSRLTGWTRQPSAANALSASCESAGS
jgi:thymidylate kinase